MLFIITRFSIPFSKMHTPDLTNPARLREHLHFFREQTLPSLKKQKDKKFRYFVLAGAQLPSEIKSSLEELKEEFPFMELYFKESMEKALEEVKDEIGNYYKGKTNGVVATTRLDDDDWLNPNFVSMIKQHTMSGNVGKFINCMYGKICYYDSNLRLINSKNYYRPKIALGLTYLSTPDNIETIYEKGNHTGLDARNFVFVKEPNMWAYNIHNFNHSKPSVPEAGDKAKAKIKVTGRARRGGGGRPRSAPPQSGARKPRKVRADAVAGRVPPIPVKINQTGRWQLPKDTNGKTRPPKKNCTT